jgi:hypothetical protein
VVWHVYTPNGVGVFYSHKMLTTGSPSWVDEGEIDGMEGDDSWANGVPFICYDPLENALEQYRENYAHIVWTKVLNEYMTDVEPYYTNSSMIEDSIDVISIFDSGTVREGLPVISTFADQTTSGGNYHGTVQFISEVSGTYPVFSVNFWLNNDYADEPEFSATKTSVSSGYSNDAGPPWVSGPSSAVYGLDNPNLVCAWTEWSYSGYAPDVYFDYN